MRTVGHYRDSELHLDALHLAGTYAEYLALDSYADVNASILGESLNWNLERIFGQNEPRIIAGKDRLNLSERLPDTMCIAWITCGWALADAEADGSHLIIVWLQDAQADPFGVLKGILAGFDWAKHAKDFCF